MNRFGGTFALVLLATLCSAYAFQDKAPLQTRNDKRNSDEDVKSGGRNLEEALLKTIGKGGIKLVVGSQTSSTTSKPPKSEHHYYYPNPEEPRYPGYPPPSHHHPLPPNYPPSYPPTGHWPPSSPHRPPYGWPHGHGNPWGYNQWQWPYYGHNHGWGNGWNNGWGNGYPYYPGYPYFRGSNGAEDGSQTELAGGPGGFQARFLAAATNNYVETKSKASAVPLYQYLNVARF